MTQDDIHTLLTDLPEWENVIGRKVEFEGIDYPSKSRKIFSLKFKVTHFRIGEEGTDVTPFFRDIIKVLTASDLNFVDVQGNYVEKTVEVTPAVLDGEGNITTPAVMDYPAGSVNEFDFWINGVLTNPIQFWEMVYSAMMKRISFFQ